MGAAAHASPNSTFFCGNVDYGAFQICMEGFHISVGVSLTSFGLLICVGLVWFSITERFSIRARKCVYYTIASIVAVFATVLIPCLFFSLFSVFGFFVTAVVVVCTSFSSISTYGCNLGFLVIYYWAFAEIVITLVLVVLAIIVGIIALFRAIVVCLIHG